MAEQLGVFGGTFDPIHIGHLVTAVDVRHELGLDRVLLVVANDPWQKVDRPVTPAAHRLAMAEAAVAGVEGVEVCDLEIRRGGASYTADTLRELGEAHPGARLHLVLGSDAAGGLETWERHDEVRDRAELAVVTRPGAEAVRPPAGWAYRVVAAPRLDVSSTELRARAASGRSLRWLVPSGAIAVIAARQLYAPGR